MIGFIKNLFAGRPKEAEANSDNQIFAISLAAMYYEDNIKGLFQNIKQSLGFEENTVKKEVVNAFCRLDMDYGPNYKKHCQQLLKQAWDVTDNTTLKEQLNWLLNQGHRNFYDICKSELDKVNGNSNAIDKSKFQTNEWKDIDIETLFENVKSASIKYPSKSIIAWDIARYVHVVRLAYLAQYITTDEGWTLLEKVVAPIKEALSSYKEFGTSFLAGRTFWNGDDDTYVFESIIKLLIEHDYSPWKLINWNA